MGGIVIDVLPSLLLNIYNLFPLNEEMKSPILTFPTLFHFCDLNDKTSKFTLNSTFNHAVVL